jgi:hypothetical protein
MSASPSLWPALRAALAGAVLLAAPAGAGATEWYVSPEGTPGGRGTRQSPWDIAGALLGRHPVKPGDTLYLRGGTYRRRPDENFVVQLAGEQGRPVHVRPAPGERATIDGGLAVQDPAAHLWVWDLEILVSEPQPARPVGPGSFPKDLTRPWGGLNVGGGRQCKYINLVIHDCRQGVSCWSSARDTELYGLVIYDNGWRATDRGHGHAIYTQNKDGTCTIRDCLMTGGHGFSMHAYGSRNAYVDNYVIAGNVAYDAGRFLVGGDRPSHHIRVLDNVLHGVSMQVGYTAPSNEDCEVRDNVVVNGALTVTRYRTAVNEGNLVLARGAPRPAGARVFLRPNRYDPGRAHLVLLNWEKRAALDVDLGAFLKAGEGYRLLNPRDLVGKAVVAGTYDGRPVRVPAAGEFTAFVLRKDGR